MKNKTKIFNIIRVMVSYIFVIAAYYCAFKGSRMNVLLFSALFFIFEYTTKIIRDRYFDI